MNDWVLLRCAATDSRGLLRRESCEPRNHRLFESRGTVRVDILTGATLCRQCFVVSTLRFGCPRVEVTEVTSVHSAMSCDFPWPCSLGETSKTNAYSNSRDRNTRRQDFGRKKKKNTGASLSEETVVISVRENELILQRAQKSNPEAQSSLRACRGKRF